MNTNNSGILASCVASATAIVCGLVAPAAGAKDHNVTAAVHVSLQGLDLSRPADARTFYQRLQRAAWEVCTGGNRVNLVPLDDPRGCYEKSLGNAIRSANLALVTNIYLASHTPQQAAACGISTQVQVASDR